MADKDGVILQLYSRARAPNRDYYGLTISTEEVILNVWHITHGPHVFPKKQRCPLVDLQIAKTLVSEIQRLFGPHVLDYCLALGRGDARLECLPIRILLRILRYLAGNDIIKLGQTSKILFELCNRNDVWGILFNKRNKSKPSRDEVKAAGQKGWKIVLKNKLVWCDGLHRTKTQKHSTSKSKVVDVNKPPVHISSNVVKKANVKPATEKKLVPIIKLPEADKSKVSQESAVKAKCIIATKNVNYIASAPNLVKPLFKTPSMTTVPKGILKKTGTPFISKTTAKLLNFAEKIENIPEVPAVVTTIDYTPMAKETIDSRTSELMSKCRRPSLNSLLNGLLSKEAHVERNAKDRHLDRFLSDLEEKDALNPFRLNSEPTSNKKLRSPSRKPSLATTKPQIRATVSSTDKMTSKFDNYLASLKGKSVHPSVEISPRTPTQAKIARSALIPKISELTRSINQMRSNFYNTDKLKMKLGTNLNNTKVANKNGCSQQLNNKLNNVVPASASTSTLEMKKNVLRTPSRSAINSIMPKSAKVKNTNCTASANQQDKPKTNSAPRLVSRNTMNVKK